MADKQQTAASGEPSQPQTTQTASEPKKVEISVQAQKQQSSPVTERQTTDVLSQLSPVIVEALCFDSTQVTEEELRTHNTHLQSLLRKVIELLKEKSALSVNLEKQNNALLLQSNSLKEVVAITKDLLSIRNMEVEHLHVDIKSMEEKINVERERHNNMLKRMAEAVKLNDNLKTEYQSQLGLFNDLRARYEEKVVLLESENKRLSTLITKNSEAFSQQPTEQSGEGEGGVQFSRGTISPP